MSASAAVLVNKGVNDGFLRAWVEFDRTKTLLPTCETINFSDNYITADGLEALVDALVKLGGAKNLRELNVSGNRIGANERLFSPSGAFRKLLDEKLFPLLKSIVIFLNPCTMYGAKRFLKNAQWFWESSKVVFLEAESVVERTWMDLIGIPMDDDSLVASMALAQRVVDNHLSHYMHQTRLQLDEVLGLNESIRPIIPRCEVWSARLSLSQKYIHDALRQCTSNGNGVSVPTRLIMEVGCCLFMHQWTRRDSRYWLSKLKSNEVASRLVEYVGYDYDIDDADSLEMDAFARQPSDTPVNLGGHESTLSALSEPAALRFAIKVLQKELDRISEGH